MQNSEFQLWDLQNLNAKILHSYISAKFLNINKSTSLNLYQTSGADVFISSRKTTQKKPPRGVGDNFPPLLYVRGLNSRLYWVSSSLRTYRQELASENGKTSMAARSEKTIDTVKVTLLRITGVLLSSLFVLHPVVPTLRSIRSRIPVDSNTTMKIIQFTNNNGTLHV